MILSLNTQAVLFLTTVAIGVSIGFLFDIFRIFRMAIPHSRLMIQLEDTVYWIIAILFAFLVMLHKNYGEIRFFSICGMFLGSLVYFLTVSRLLLLISDRIIAAVKYCIQLLLQILWTPFHLLFLLFRKPVERLYYFVFGFWKKILHFIKRYVKIKMKQFYRKMYCIIRKS